MARAARDYDQCPIPEIVPDVVDSPRALARDHRPKGINVKKHFRVAAATVAFAGFGMLTGPALAASGSGSGGSGGGGEVRVRQEAACSATSWIKLDLRSRPGRAVRFEAEVDHSVAGAAWTVTVVDNGATIVNGVSMTADAAGEVEVEGRLASAASHAVTASASGPSGETCSVTATI